MNGNILQADGISNTADTTAVSKRKMELLHRRKVCTPLDFNLTRQPILGVPIDFIDDSVVLEIIEYWRQNREKGYICVVNPWSIVMNFCDVEMRLALMESKVSLPDGVGIILAARILNYGHKERIAGPDLMFRICDRGRKYGYRHFFYGGHEDITKTLTKHLCADLPGLQIAGQYSPPYRKLSKEEDEAIIDRINVTKPDIVWVGLGAPKQEKWMLKNWAEIKGTALIGVGAAFDFHSGNLRRAPKLMQWISCEWFWRLMQEPRRLWPKNIVNPFFIAAVIAQRFAMRYSGKSTQGRRKGSIY